MSFRWPDESRKITAYISYLVRKICSPALDGDEVASSTLSRLSDVAEIKGGSTQFVRSFIRRCFRQACCEERKRFTRVNQRPFSSFCGASPDGPEVVDGGWEKVFDVEDRADSPPEQSCAEEEWALMRTVLGTALDVIRAYLDEPLPKDISSAQARIWTDKRTVYRLLEVVENGHTNKDVADALGRSAASTCYLRYQSIGDVCVRLTNETVRLGLDFDGRTIELLRVQANRELYTRIRGTHDEFTV